MSVTNFRRFLAGIAVIAACVAATPTAQAQSSGSSGSSGSSAGSSGLWDLLFQNPMSLLSSGFLILWMTAIYLFTLTSPQTCMKRCLIHRKLVNAQPLLLWSHEAVNKTFKSDPRDTARNLHGHPMDLRKKLS